VLHRPVEPARYIGEVGIDAGPKFYRSLDTQKEIFEHVLKRCARVGGKVLTVHSVRSAKIVLDLVEQHLPLDRGQLVLHWFTGSKSEARRAVELGCYFSVNSQMFLNERGRELVEILPRERLLTETDGPFTQIGNRSTVPSDVSVVVEQIAKLHSIEVSVAASQIRQNLRLLIDSTMAKN
jgi:TatD DNase family protein